MYKYLITALLILMRLISGAQNCPSGNVILTSQNEVDSFRVNYPNCTEIEGDLVIGNPDLSFINSLDSLIGLTSISGSLVIGGNLYLENLNGLNNLVSIGNDFRTYVIKTLTHGTAQIGNGNLESLEALQNLQFIGGDLEIVNNSSLSVCDMDWICSYLNNPNGIVNIYGNAEGCKSVVDVAQNCGDSLPCLPYGNYRLYSQDDIDNFSQAFPNCNDLQGDLLIMGNADMTNFNGLNGLTSIGDDLWIFNCTGMDSPEGLENLNSIGGDLLLEGNAFYSLSGLDNVQSIGGALIITGQENLSDLSGLNNIEGSSINSLLIMENPNLSTCDVESICGYLASPGANPLITNNGSGCSSVEEVETACSVGFDEFSAEDGNFNIYPNPANDKIWLTGPSIQDRARFEIFSTEGRRLFNIIINDEDNFIDISTLSPGFYIGRLSGNRNAYVKKIVKE